MVNLDVPSKWRPNPCSPPLVCPLITGCPRCNAGRVRRRTFSLLRTIDIIESQTPCNYGLLTVTLPGKSDRSQIRFGTLAEQFRFITKKSKYRIGDKRYSQTMRSLPNRLLSSGVDGCIIGLEFTNGGGINENWNTHAHILCISTSKITIPESKKKIDPMDPLMEYEELGERNPWSYENLASLGFGAQYQYTHVGGITDVLREIGKITYGVKVQKNELGEMNARLAREMQEFFKSPQKLLRKTGIAINTWEEKLEFAQKYPDHPASDYILNYEFDTNHLKYLERFMLSEGYVKVDRYGDVIGKRKDYHGIIRNKSEHFWWSRPV